MAAVATSDRKPTASLAKLGAYRRLCPWQQPWPMGHAARTEPPVLA
jgi:hypothetical protein